MPNLLPNPGRTDHDLPGVRQHGVRQLSGQVDHVSDVSQEVQPIPAQAQPTGRETDGSQDREVGVKKKKKKKVALIFFVCRST